MATGGRGTNSCPSDGRAIARGTSVDTGTLDTVATIDPCDPGGVRRHSEASDAMLEPDGVRRQEPRATRYIL